MVKFSEQIAQQMAEERPLTRTQRKRAADIRRPARMFVAPPSSPTEQLRERGQNPENFERIEKPDGSIVFVSKPTTFTSRRREEGADETSTFKPDEFEFKDGRLIQERHFTLVESRSGKRNIVKLKSTFKFDAQGRKSGREIEYDDGRISSTTRFDRGVSFTQERGEKPKFFVNTLTGQTFSSFNAALASAQSQGGGVGRVVGVTEPAKFDPRQKLREEVVEEAPGKFMKIRQRQAEAQRQRLLRPTAPEPKPVFTGAVISAAKPFERKRITTFQEFQEFQARQEAPIRETSLQFLEKQQQKLEKRAEKVEVLDTRLIIPEVAAGALAAPIGVARFIVRPIKSIKGLGRAITHPFETGAAIRGQIETRPAAFQGEIAGLILTGKGLGAAAKKFPVKIEISRIPGGRVLGVTARRRALPIAAIQEGRIIRPSRVSFEKITEFPVETATQRATIQRSIRAGTTRVVTGEETKLPLTFQVVKATETTPSKFITELPKRTLRLTPRQTEIVLGVAKERGAKVFGSFPQQAQVPRALQRIPVDIDIKLAGEGTITEAAQVTVRRLRAAGTRARVSPQIEGAVEVPRAGVFEKAVEFKTSEFAGELGEVAPERFIGFDLTQRPIVLEGVKVSRLSEQGLRKAASITTLRKTPGGDLVFAPKSFRTKDITDFFAVQETLLASRRLPSIRGRLALEELKLKFPEKLISRARSPAKIELGVPRPSRPPSPLIPAAAPSPLIPAARIPELKSIIREISRPPSRTPGISKAFFPSPSLSLSPALRRSLSPSLAPSRRPSLSPALRRSLSPSIPSSISPSIAPSRRPSLSPALRRSLSPSIPRSPSFAPLPSAFPSISPSPSPIPPELKDFLKTTKKRSKRRRKQRQDIFALLPDFTARAVGIQPIELGVKEALREIKRIQTGLEIRPGARIGG